MKKIKIQISILIITICSACSIKQEKTNDFKETVYVKRLDTIYCCSDLLGPVTGMDSKDSILIIKHALDDYHFSFFNLNKKKMIGRWGEIGDGPEQFSQIGNSMSISDDSLIFQDIAKQELNYVAISDLLSNRNIDNQHLVVSKKKYPYNKNFRPFKIYAADKQWITVGAFSSGYIKMINSKKEIIESNTTEYPFICDEIQNLYRGSAFQTQVKLNEKLKKFIHTFNASDVFEIYEFSDSTLRRTYINDFSYPPKTKYSGGQSRLDAINSIAGFIGCTVSKNMICFLYSTNDYLTATSSKEILCYDWNGNKLKKYILPTNVCNICLVNQELYATIEENDSLTIVSFEISYP